MKDQKVKLSNPIYHHIHKNKIPRNKPTQETKTCTLKTIIC